MITNTLLKCSSLLVAMAVTVTTAAFAQEKESPAKLESGMKAPSLDLEGIQWVQGEPVKDLDGEGKVYMIECWATWCGPCIVAIPHVNELAQKYADKGLVVIGMSSLEDDLKKVETFVSNQGDGMSYRVAFSGGRKSEFSKQWLYAAGVRGIPHTFLVKDGDLVLMGHPMDIDDQLIESLLSGEFDQAAYDARIAEKKSKEEAINSKVYPMAQSKQWPELEAFARKELADDPATQRKWLVIANANMGDWANLKEILSEPGEKNAYELMLVQSAFITDEGEGAEAFASMALETFTAERIGELKGVQTRLGPALARARFLWLSGDKDQAKQIVNDFAGELTKWDDSERSKKELSGMMERLLEKLEGGEFPPMAKLMGR